MDPDGIHSQARLDKGPTSTEVLSTHEVTESPSVFENTPASVCHVEKSIFSLSTRNTPLATLSSTTQAKHQDGRMAASPTQVIVDTEQIAKVAAHMDGVSALVAQAIAKSPLFKLPPEMRNHIYSYALAIEGGVCRVTREEGVPEPNLLFACKLVRKEAIGIFYHINEVKVVLRDFHPAADILFTSKSRALSHELINLPKAERLYDGSMNWHNLKLWLRAIHAGKADAWKRREQQTSVQETAKAKGNMVKSFRRLVKRLSHKPWDHVEPILENIRIKLMRADSQWRIDEILTRVMGQGRVLVSMGDIPF